MSPEEETVINRNTMKLQEHLYKALKQRDQYKKERDTLIEDLKVLRAKNEKLRAEKFGLKLNLIESTKLGDGFLKRYEQLTDHIRLKASANPGVSRYIDLVNYIDRLERD